MRRPLFLRWSGKKTSWRLVSIPGPEIVARRIATTASRAGAAASATSTEAAAATAPGSAATAAETAASAASAVLSLLDDQGLLAQGNVVEVLDGIPAVGILHHLHETEPLALAGLPVHDHLGRLYGSELLEDLGQLGVIKIVRETRNEKCHTANFE